MPCLVPDVVVWTHIVGVTREDVRLSILVHKVEHLLTVAAVAHLSAIEDRDVNAEYHHLILRNECQIFFQPLELLGGEGCLVVGCEEIILVSDITHTYNMHITTIEREVHRSEALLEVALHL